MDVISDQGQLISSALTPVLEESSSPQNGYLSALDRKHGDDNSESKQVRSHIYDVADNVTPSQDRSRTYTLRDTSPFLENENGNQMRKLTMTDTLEANQGMRRQILRLSPTQMQGLISPDAFPVPFMSLGSGTLPSRYEQQLAIADYTESDALRAATSGTNARHTNGDATGGMSRFVVEKRINTGPSLNAGNNNPTQLEPLKVRPQLLTRTVSNPMPMRNRPFQEEGRRISKPNLMLRMPTHVDNLNSAGTLESIGPETPLMHEPLPSPVSTSIPIPPLSMPTYLQLELSSSRPSPLYIHHSLSSDFPYESSKVKFDRLLNFFKVPYQLEQVLLFGALTCLDAWLYTFTILPLRFIKASWLLLGSCAGQATREIRGLGIFIYAGVRRIWYRRRQNSNPTTPMSAGIMGMNGNFDQDQALQMNIPDLARSPPNNVAYVNGQLPGAKAPRVSARRHRRTKSIPSLFQANHKADILQGLLILTSCMILLRFDASRMYHAIRGQAAIKLYVIYNVLEVCDRLFSALGQDILECLFSRETLERDANGRSRIMRPFWLFLIALIYNVIHATALFYQVITLNAAVNSYSNALLTLLMSNQFVEIKGAVFKKFEKENLFQITCADVVERFQLWLMLLIIALRNIVEVGGLSINLGALFGPFNSATKPLRTCGMLPNSFNIMPALLPFQVLSPFLLVLGSEMLVDWLKHAYITKFNAVKPAIYDRFFDVLAKDYYSNAFAEQSFTRRLGLPVMPLACLFIRAALQTYHMFLVTTVSTPAMSSVTGLSLDSSVTPSPIISQIDRVLRSALGRFSFDGGSFAHGLVWTWTLDDGIALATMVVFFLALYLLLLAFKLGLGMVLLGLARGRYRGMKKREQEQVVETGGKRVGGCGLVEVGEERRRWIYDGDAEGLNTMRNGEAKAKEKGKEGISNGNRGFGRGT